MNSVIDVQELTYQERLEALRQTKLAQTQEKQQVIGAMDHDDWAMILPPPEYRKIVQAISGSGVPITDVRIDGVELVSTEADGSFFGPQACGENFRRLLDAHPPYIDPLCSLAGALMANFTSYRKQNWKAEFDYSHLRPEQEKYQLSTGIGGSQHFCPDLAIGFELGWHGILDSIYLYRALNAPRAADFYDGLEAVALGMQNWIRRHAVAARRMAQTETDPQLRRNLEEMAAINEWLVDEPPRTFREACQWMVWYLMAARMYNGSGALGRLDVLLTPFYERDIAAGRLTDEEASFHIACLLLRDTAYAQLGGPDAQGHDVTNRVSYLVLDAIEQLQIPANIGVCVGAEVDPDCYGAASPCSLPTKWVFPSFWALTAQFRDWLTMVSRSNLPASAPIRGVIGARSPDGNIP